MDFELNEHFFNDDEDGEEEENGLTNDNNNNIFQNEEVGNWVKEWKSRSDKTIKSFKNGIKKLFSNEKEGQEIIKNSQLAFPSAFTHKHYIFYAEKLELLSKFEEAIFYLKKALKFKELKNDHKIEMNFRIALLYADLNKNEEALKCYENALLIDRNNIEVMREYTNLLIKIGEIEKAEEILKISIKNSPDEEEIYQLFASHLSKQQRNNEAIEILEKIKLTENPEILNDMANLYSLLKRNEESISCYKKIIEIDEGLLEFRYGFVQLLISLNQFDDAIKECQKILEIDPEYYDTFDALALCYFNIKEYKNAIEIWEKIINSEDQLFNCRPDIGLAYIKLRNYYEAEKIIKIEMEKRNTSYALFAYGITLYKLGKFQSSIDYFNLAKNFDYSNSDDVMDEIMLQQCLDDLHYYYAKCLMKLKKSDEKEIFNHFNLSIEENPEYSKSHYRLAQLYLKSNPPDIENAKTNFLLAIEKNKTLAPSTRLSERVVIQIIETVNSL